MPVLFLERHVPHMPERMYDLISDVRSYPKFIPNCRAVDVTPTQDPNVSLVKLTISFGPITQAYTSTVTLDPANLTVAAASKDGLFAYLDSKWSIEREEEGSRVRFDIDFKIANPLLAAVAEPAFSAKQTEIIEAFVDEADRRWGQ